ncbi:MAG: tRNA (adenosine(37)-N6)-threonylcarbamoyltransferase complex ATPase subunit type 1 TsaE, partial [Candidatus Limisoma sp.]|nr:tRNA (adenosine(37)-N6)-threonylcarbamoyltransferase complex ATPase subunit type 1 TsaE [Bacteroidales bacterium]MDY5894700.1 tRNA (adenosine(37)-N6)-threonylcarbamoyltransferase complex ATPase subunit type 1 TsaE [Candidatus Limisoma sp.]
CYRLESEDEAYDVGAEDYFDCGAVCMVEWPEKIEALLPYDTVRVDIDADNNDARTITVEFPKP